MIIRAIDSIEKGALKNLKNYLQEDSAIIFSDLDPFELSRQLSKNKSMARAKVGQVVNEDIVIEPGPTEFVPGPIVSELGNLGIKFAVEDGKITIKEKKVILKAGEKVSEETASIMTKLDMKPIAIGLEPIVAYDTKEDRIYEDIKIDKEKVIGEIKTSARKALGLAVKLGYYCKETIGFLLRKASAEAKVLERKVNENVGIHNDNESKTEKNEEKENEEKEIKESNSQTKQDEEEK